MASPAENLTSGATATATGASGTGNATTLGYVCAPRTPFVQKRWNHIKDGSSDRRKVTYMSVTSRSLSPKAIVLMAVSLPLNRPLRVVGLVMFVPKTR